MTTPKRIDGDFEIEPLSRDSGIEDFDEMEARGVFVFRPGPEDTGRRLDRYLTARFSDYSRGFMQRVIATGRVRVDNTVRMQTFKVTAGQTISVEVPEVAAPEIIPQNIPLAIVYEDEHVIVIDKPAGMVVHPAPGHPDGTVVNAILHHCSEIDINGSSRPGIVHRLDKDTSGLMVIAKTSKGQALLLGQWADGSVDKGYTGLVRGVVEPNEGTIDAPIGRDPQHRLKMAVIGSGRYATTHFSVVRRFEGASLLDMTIDTGRTHQIRAHLAFIGHPIVGDSIYNSEKGRFGGENALVARQFLHAYRLGLTLSNGMRRVFTSSLPRDLERALAALNDAEMVAGNQP